MPNYSVFSLYAVTDTQILLTRLLIDSTKEEIAIQSFTGELYKAISYFDLWDFSKKLDKC